MSSFGPCNNAACAQTIQDDSDAVFTIGSAMVASCNVVGGAGLSLYSGAGTRDQCNQQCVAQASTHPNRTCMWVIPTLLKWEAVA